MEYSIRHLAYNILQDINATTSYTGIITSQCTFDSIFTFCLVINMEIIFVALMMAQRKQYSSRYQTQNDSQLLRCRLLELA